MAPMARLTMFVGHKFSFYWSKVQNIIMKYLDGSIKHELSGIACQKYKILH